MRPLLPRDEARTAAVHDLLPGVERRVGGCRSVLAAGRSLQRCRSVDAAPALTGTTIEIIRTSLRRLSTPACERSLAVCSPEFMYLLNEVVTGISSGDSTPSYCQPLRASVRHP